MNKKIGSILSTVFIISILLIFSFGCGGGGGGGGDSTPSLQSGVFIDSIVDGLGYETATQSGYTENGTFKYFKGETVSFYIGNLLIGQGVAKSKMSPIDLVSGATNASNATVTNICRLLQSLDYDGNPNNGIIIRDDIAAQVDNYLLVFEQSINNFESSNHIANLFDSLNNLGLYAQGVTGALVPAAQAQAHMMKSLGELPDGIVNTATGTYMYNSNSGQLTVNYTHSDFTGCGPQTSQSDQLTVLSENSDQMILDDNDEGMIWTRDSGTGSGLVGNWTFYDNDNGNTYQIEFKADGSIIVVGYIVYCSDEGTAGGTFAVPYKTITIDGDYSDWQTGDRVYLDTNGPDCGNEPGLDLKEVYITQDTDFIYLRYILNGPLDDTYQYMFGENSRHIWVVSWNSSVRIAYSSAYYPQVALPGSFVHVDGGQFEAKFYKSDVKDYWIGQSLASWLDQGVQTPCRDYVELPELLIDW